MNFTTCECCLRKAKYLCDLDDRPMLAFCKACMLDHIVQVHGRTPEQAQEYVAGIDRWREEHGRTENDL